MGNTLPYEFSTCQWAPESNKMAIRMVAMLEGLYDTFVCEQEGLEGCCNMRCTSVRTSGFSHQTKDSHADVLHGSITLRCIHAEVMKGTGASS